MNRFTESPSDIIVSDFLLETLKTELRIIGDDRDAQLGGLLEMSSSLIERYTGRLLTERVVKGEFGNSTPSRVNNEYMLDCLRAPVFDDALVSIHFNGVDSQELLDGFIAPVGEYGECFITSEPTQEQNPERLYACVVLFKAGYKVVDDVWQCPIPLQQAVVALAGYMFSNPLDCGSSGCNCSGSSSNGIKLPSGVAGLISTYIIKRYDHALYL